MTFLKKAALFYNAEPHQDKAWDALEAALTPEQLEAFKAAYRNETPTIEERPPVDEFPLDVPYFYQRDSKSGHGERMCFSSSMAMAIEYLDPEAIDGDDDTYLEQVFRYGDSVSSTAQIKAARSLGMDCDFYTDLSEQDLIDQLDKGIPVPIGILHKGTIDHPTGGGHWICLIGYDEKYFHVHDPFGELSLLGGGYPKAGPTDGENQRYTRKNLMKRFLIASKNDGWGVIFR